MPEADKPRPGEFGENIDTLNGYEAFAMIP
jgi:hypothetical protein